jgi:hypothetical protein
MSWLALVVAVYFGVVLCFGYYYHCSCSNCSPC